MQHIDPFSDDFFKKAAEDYPLKTAAGEWENVAKKLAAIQVKDQTVSKRNFRSISKRSILVGALLVIPFAITVTKYFSIQHKAATEIVVKNRPVDLQSESSLEALNGAGKNNTVYKPASVNIEKFVAEKNDIEKKQNFFGELSLPGKTVKDNGVNDLISEKNFNNKTGLSLKADVETSDEKINQLNGKQKRSGVTENKYSGFYIGAAIAPELTSVKLQPARKSFDIGLLIGYNLNKKLSIELGFMLAQKYYYTSGKYIVPNSIGPDDSKILRMNAFNSITEMPLTVQYNLRNENNSRWFVSTGAVSYIVHKENYSYIYTKDGEQKEGRTLHNKASQNWFSNVQMSVGYERSFNKICNIRIEPYCRVPLKGIGISNVPVTSAGVNLALIKAIK